MKIYGKLFSLKGAEIKNKNYKSKSESAFPYLFSF
jgi:hypothetical protein